MDLTAITLCRENKLPIIVFNINTRGNLRKLLLGEDVGTLVSDTATATTSNKHGAAAMMKDILKDAADRMDKSVEALRQELT
jgi:hypothetical protein